MTHKEVEEYLLSMPNARLDYPFGEDVAVYKVGDKMFALVAEKSNPVKLSLKCDPQLATVLREKYDRVEPRLADLDQLQTIAGGYPNREAFLSALAL